jgi:hypothetical protein
MSSTRMKNDMCDYKIQQNAFKQEKEYMTYKGQAISNPVGFSQVGLGIGQMPNFLLSENAVDIGSYLKGINSTNLVNPQQPIKPELNCLPEIKVYQTPAKVIMPKPLVIEKNQRFHVI